MIVPVFSPYCCANYHGTYGQAGSSHRVLGLVVFSLYSSRLQYNLTVLAPATLPAWPLSGHPQVTGFSISGRRAKPAEEKQNRKEERRGHNDRE